MPQGRSLVFEAIPKTPSVTSLDAKSRPEEGPESDEARVFEDVEDWVDRWVSVAVFGALATATSLWILIGVSRPGGDQNLGIPVAFFGLLELVLGTFAAYILRPQVMTAVAVAGVLTIADGVMVALGGTELPWIAGIASVVLGLGCAAVGTLQSVRNWVALYRGDGTTA